MDGVTVYTALAKVESAPKLAEVYRRLAAVERAHGQFWRKHIYAVGGEANELKSSLGAKLPARLAATQSHSPITIERAPAQSRSAAPLA